MTNSRRAVLQGFMAAALSSAAVPRAAFGAERAPRFSNPLRVPPLAPGRLAGAERVFELAIQAGRTEFIPGRTTPTIGVNGSYLGPTLRLRRGERVRIDVTNRLEISTTLHWHGLRVPAAMDGGPHEIIRPGRSWSPTFTIGQEASTFWYHSHMMERTGEQVNLGLAGAIILDDETSVALGLPSEYGVDDIPLVIQDRRFRADGRLDYVVGMHDMMMGFRGDTILVNGTLAPYLVLQRRRTRLRLLNGSSARIYNLALSDGRPLVQIASDGSLLEKPVSRRSIRLAPGERAEVLLDVEPDSSVHLVSLPDRAGSGGTMMGMMSDTEELSLLDLRATRLDGERPALPERLIDVPSWDPGQAERRRVFTLEMGMMGMMGGGRMGRPMGRGMGGGGMGGMTINGKMMDMERIDERVRLGSVEIWTIRNATPLPHPFHVHGVQFRVLDRDGVPAPAHERGLKDTVLVEPRESVRIITQFTERADPSRPYMYHCHILEHEDAGMMGQFVVEP